MRNLILGAATLVLAAATFPLTASAEIEYPYCASGRGTGGCSYATLDQCRASVSGAGGYCYSNPPTIHAERERLRAHAAGASLIR